MRANAQAVAGVMGGSTSEVSDATRDIFLEVAYFDPARVRRTRRALQLSTDASYRYERGIDIDGIPRALARAAQLLVAVAGGSIEDAPIDLYPMPKSAPSIPLATAQRRAPARRARRPSPRSRSCSRRLDSP